jgi:hypothetical protein
MEQPKRKKELNKNILGQIEFKYVDDMLEYYKINNLTIDLRKFSTAEITVNPTLYEMYLNQLKTERMNKELKEIYELTLLLQAKILDLKIKVKNTKDLIE